MVLVLQLNPEHKGWGETKFTTELVNMLTQEQIVNKHAAADAIEVVYPGGKEAGSQPGRKRMGYNGVLNPTQLHSSPKSSAWIMWCNQ